MKRSGKRVGGGGGGALVTMCHHEKQHRSCPDSSLCPATLNGNRYSLA